MAGQERTAADSLGLAEQDVEGAWRHGFFPAVSLLERLAPGAPRVGGLGPVAEEAIRFRHDPSLEFHSSDVKKITVQRGPVPGHEIGPSRVVYEIVTTFLGLTGSVTPMPLHIAEEILIGDPDDSARREFLDVFHHRLLSLFYRQRAKYNYATEYLSDQTDLWSKRILALAGVDTFEASPATTLPMWRLLRLAPLLADRSRTAHKLQLALRDVLAEPLDGATLTIQQFAGRWVEIEERQRMKLGLQNTILGKDITVGTRMQDRGGKFRIVIGPLSQGNFKHFSEGGAGLQTVRDVVALFSRDELAYDLELILGKDAATSFRLATIGSEVPVSRLGKDTWLGRRQEETRVVVDVLAALEAPDERSEQAPGGARGEHTPDASGGTDDDFDMAEIQPSSREGRHAR